jgi:two-component system, NtrC family, sensor histidine kinase PilS
MFRLAKQNFSLTGDLAFKIRRLIVGRLVLIFLIIISGLWWTSSYRELSVGGFAAKGFLLFCVAAGLTGIYLLALYLNRSYLWQVRLQFLADIVLITLIVRETGNAISPYTTLYLVLISVVGVFSSKFETIFIALFSAFCFAALSLFSAESLGYSLSGETVPSGLVQILSFNTIGILIVGLLAGHLSDRRTFSKKLRETTESFIDLHVLHESIVESIRSGLITTDPEGVIYAFNPAAEDISGIDSVGVLGRSIFSVFPEKVHPEINACLNRAVAGKTFPTRHFEAALKAEPDGADAPARKTTVACSVLPLIEKTGRVNGLILTFQDITEIRVMEETLRRSDRLAAVGRMAAGLAHEIRNPLGSMSSALQFLQRKAVPATPEGNLIDVVLSESERLDKIIANFLTYANPSADIFAGEELNEMDVNRALRECLTLLRHSPELRETHELNLHLADGPVMIEANETQIKQVFWNVLRNSLQAMPAGGKLNVRLNEFAGRSVKIIFEDTGCGISAENLKHLFEPFTSTTGGSGLGLSIVRRIVRSHGGQIDVRSRENEGARFVIELPYKIKFLKPETVEPLRGAELREQ